MTAGEVDHAGISGIAQFAQLHVFILIEFGWFITVSFLGSLALLLLFALLAVALFLLVFLSQVEAPIAYIALTINSLKFNYCFSFTAATADAGCIATIGVFIPTLRLIAWLRLTVRSPATPAGLITLILVLPLRPTVAATPWRPRCFRRGRVFVRVRTPLYPTWSYVSLLETSAIIVIWLLLPTLLGAPKLLFVFRIVSSVVV